MTTPAHPPGSASAGRGHMIKQLATPRHAAADSTPPSSGRLSHPDDVRTIIDQQKRLQEQFEALQQQQPSAWVSALPIALLGIRAAFREDLGCSSAELVYGTTLRLPAEFFSPSQAATASTPTQYVDSLRSSLSAFRPQDAAPRLANRPAYIPQDLTTAELVYLRTDAVRKPMQPPYSGPYRVLQRSPKYFKIEVNGKSALVSIDRLKPAYSLSALSPV